MMEERIIFHGRYISKKDIALIRKIIKAYPDGSRRLLSQEVCRAWNWVQPNGVLKDMACRTLMLYLERKGLIKLPPPKQNPPNPLAHRKKPVPISIDQTPIECSLKELLPITLKQVRRTPLEKLFNSLIEQYHYLGYAHPVGEHLKYIAFSNNRPIACFAWSSAPWYIGVRDRFIGWPPEVRKKNLHLIINNTRFLIFNWIKVKHLASHLLALSRRIVPEDWQSFYNHPIYFMETFVDTEKFAGTCYKADNWIYLGETTGRGKLSKSSKPVLSKKAVYGYPKRTDFRKFLNG